LVQENAKKIKVHTFGIGSDCSRDLLVKIAKVGRGTANFEDDE
jgi:hypothetical protein